MTKKEKEIEKQVMKINKLTKTLGIILLIILVFSLINNLIMNYNPSFDYNDVCVYIDKNLNLPVKFSIEGFDDYIGIDINKINLIEYECLRKIIKLAKDLYGTAIIDRSYMIEEKEVTTDNIKNRVLEFKLNKRNNV
jgi:hypothetical protein